MNSANRHIVSTELNSKTYYEGHDDKEWYLELLQINTDHSESTTTSKEQKKNYQHTLLRQLNRDQQRKKKKNVFGDAITEEDDLYATLGIKDKQCSIKEITNRFRKLSKINHPDANSTSRAKEDSYFDSLQKEINSAYRVLSDPKKRAVYDVLKITSVERTNRVIELADKVVQLKRDLMSETKNDSSMRGNKEEYDDRLFREALTEIRYNEIRLQNRLKASFSSSVSLRFDFSKIYKNMFSSKRRGRRLRYDSSMYPLEQSIVQKFKLPISDRDVLKFSLQSGIRYVPRMEFVFPQNQLVVGYEKTFKNESKMVLNLKYKSKKQNVFYNFNPLELQAQYQSRIDDSTVAIISTNSKIAPYIVQENQEPDSLLNLLCTSHPAMSYKNSKNDVFGDIGRRALDCVGNSSCDNILLQITKSFSNSFINAGMQIYGYSITNPVVFVVYKHEDISYTLQTIPGAQTQVEVEHCYQLLSSEAQEEDDDESDTEDEFDEEKMEEEIDEKKIPFFKSNKYDIYDTIKRDVNFIESKVTETQGKNRKWNYNVEVENKVSFDPLHFFFKKISPYLLPQPLKYSSFGLETFFTTTVSPKKKQLETTSEEDQEGDDKEDKKSSSYNPYRRVSDHKFGIGVAHEVPISMEGDSWTHNSEGGITLKLLYEYSNSFKINIPFIKISDEFSWKTFLASYIVPSSLFYLGKRFLYNPYKRKKLKEKLLKFRKENFEETKEERQKIESQMESEEIVSKVKESIEQEEAINGLIIVNAIYGHIDSQRFHFEKYRSKQDEPFIRELDKYPPFVDVTRQLQYRVENSSLTIREGHSKSKLEGFFDPCKYEKKKLRVFYRFKDKTHKIEVNDTDSLAIPLKHHLIE